MKYTITMFSCKKEDSKISNIVNLHVGGVKAKCGFVWSNNSSFSAEKYFFEDQDLKYAVEGAIRKMLRQGVNQCIFHLDDDKELVVDDIGIRLSKETQYTKRSEERDQIVDSAKEDAVKLMLNM